MCDRSVTPAAGRTWSKWSVGLLASVGVLGAAGYLAGRPQPDKLDGVLDTLASVAGRPAVALALACAALVHTAWCVRHLILHWLAWGPDGSR